MAALLRILGLGAVLSAVSELWFYPVDLNWGLVELFPFYGVLAYVAWLLVAQTGARGAAACFLAACLFGFLVEGVPVPVLYTAAPFTILWTSMAWHALISVGVGLWLFRKISARSGLLGQVVFCVLSGVYLGAWSVELWSIPVDGQEWVWPDIQTVWRQFLLGWAVFIGGHICLNMAARFTVTPARWELPLWACVTGLAFVGSYGITLFPVSLLLPILVGGVAALIWRARQMGPSADLVRLSNWTVPILSMIVSLLIPLCAIASLGAFAAADLRWESSAFHILWAGPVCIIATVLSVWRIIRLPRAFQDASG